MRRPPNACVCGTMRAYAFGMRITKKDLETLGTMTDAIWVLDTHGMLGGLGLLKDAELAAATGLDEGRIHRVARKAIRAGLLSRNAIGELVFTVEHAERLRTVRAAVAMGAA